VNIIEAIDDANLFNGEFDGESWQPWRAFLKSLFGLSMNIGEFLTFRQCTACTSRRREPYREAALIVGRRGGKSRALALIATFLACFVDWQPYLAPGEEAVIAIVASDRRQARVILSYIRGFLRNVEILEELLDVDQTETLRLSNRVVIEIHTAKIASPRGRTFAAVLCDEIAFWQSDDSANPDKEVLNAVRPGLASLARAGSMLLLASSPYARRGALYEAYRRHYGKVDARVLIWKTDTLTMNPAFAKAIIDEAYDDDPAAAAAEYGGEFRSDIESYISREAIDQCTIASLHERLPEDSKNYSAFVDPSGGSSDSFTLAIAHRDGDIGVLDVIRERRPPFSPESVVAEFTELLQRYSIREVSGDHYAGEWPRERFQEHGVTYLPSAKNKSAIYGELLPLLNSGKVELLNHARLQVQLSSLERRTARGGRDSIDHSPGAHDDVANAVAGALVGVAGRPHWLDVWMKL
jgi:hypothetical protein